MAKAKNTKILSEAQLANKYPKAGRASSIAVTTESTIRLPSRIIALNHQLNGGLLYGKILEEFGEESTGKSLLAMDFAYTTQALGGEVIWADAENAFNSAWFEKNGIDLTRLHIMTEQSAMEVISDWVMDMVVFVRSKLTKNEPILLVIDSLAAIRCLNEVSEYQTDASAKFGNRAKAISDFLGNRSVLLASMGVCVILINQLRRKIGASKFEDPDKTVGGDATKFYASQRIGLARGKQIVKAINGRDKKVGQIVYIRTKKDKTGPPRSSTSTEVYFIKTKTNNIGFNKYMGLPDLLVELGVVDRKKGSSRFYYKDKMVANGEEAFLKVLDSDEELRKKLILKSGINTISRTQKQLDELQSNLYPVITGKKTKEDE